jgi:hypothetical protein
MNMNEYKDNLIVSTIERIIRSAQWYHLIIEGNPSEKWFILRNAHLAPYFTCDSCDIMVRIEPDDRIAIFFPDYVGIDTSKESCVCQFFLYRDAIQGWRRVCTGLTIYSLGPLDQNIAVLLQFVQNPMLCGLQGCDAQIFYIKMLRDLEGELLNCEEDDFKYEPDIEQHENVEKNKTDD